VIILYNEPINQPPWGGTMHHTACIAILTVFTISLAACDPTGQTDFSSDIISSQGDSKANWSCDQAYAGEQFTCHTPDQLYKNWYVMEIQKDGETITLVFNNGPKKLTCCEMEMTEVGFNWKDADGNVYYCQHFP